MRASALIGGRSHNCRMSVLPPLILSTEASRLASDRDLRRAHAAGLLHRVAPGVYVDAAVWRGLSADERYRVLVRAAAHRSDPVALFSHDSAAAMWRLPSIGPWPTKVHELTPWRAGGNSRVGIQRHGLGSDPDAAGIDGVRVTSLARTVVDISCTSPLVRAVAMLDSAQRQPDPREARWAAPEVVDREMILATLDDLRPYIGARRAETAIRLSSGLSGSAGESFARMQFHALGYPAPELQVEFRDSQGFIGFADFYWPEIDLIVEFDGLSKYGSGRMFQTELTTEQIVLREKTREDRLRHVVRSFARIDWAISVDRRRLAQHVMPHGLVPW